MKAISAFYLIFCTCTLSVTGVRVPKPRGIGSPDNLNMTLVRHLLNRINWQRGQLQAKQPQITSLQSQLYLEKEKTRHLEEENNRRVVFTAWISAEPLVRASAGSVIPFGYVVVNIGQAFNPRTSAFTAPYDGVYMFFVHAVISADYRTFYLVKNGHNVAECDSDGTERQLACGTTMSLRVGDKVTVVHYNSRGHINAGMETAFSGFRIR